MCSQACLEGHGPLLFNQCSTMQMGSTGPCVYIICPTQKNTKEHDHFCICVWLKKVINVCMLPNKAPPAGANWLWSIAGVETSKATQTAVQGCPIFLFKCDSDLCVNSTNHGIFCVLICDNSIYSLMFCSAVHMTFMSLTVDICCDSTSVYL